MNKKIIIPTILSSLMITGIIISVSAVEPSFGQGNMNFQNERRSIEDCQNMTFEDWQAEHQTRINGMQTELNSMDETTWNKMKEYREALRSGDSETADALKEELGIEDGKFGKGRSEGGIRGNGGMGRGKHMNENIQQ
jgi:hypothetical protein